jgi:hypothetical protein
MTQSGVRNRIEARIGQGEFLANMLHSITRESSEVHGDFVDRLSAIAESVRALLENSELIRRFDYSPTKYWPSIRGRKYAFVDGGVASIDLPSAAPIGIRVGSYVVIPGDETEGREQFNIELALVDDLYSDSGVVFDDDFFDLAKLRDAARMVSELAAGFGIARASERVDSVILHGPLVNPVAPYGTDNFPSFGLEACRTFLGDPQWTGELRDRQFVALYANLLERTRGTGIPVVGVVERSIGRDPVFIRRVLSHLVKKELLQERDARNLEKEIISYGLNDSSLLDVVLGDGEYVEPIPVDRQGPASKWPEDWKFAIENYPKVLTTYLKPSALVTPFRVEAFEDIVGHEAVLELIFHTSRMLPSYGFPVGLDIVDRFAKVPAWLSRGVKGQHQIVLLKRALASDDPRAISFAKRVLAAKGRDWLFQPSA